MTTLLFREDAYRTSCPATVLAVNDLGGIVLDQTVFYATAGGQPGDKGVIHAGNRAITIATTVYDAEKNIVHVPAPGQTLPAVGEAVTAEIDWVFRHGVMRRHTMMHLLCACVPFPVTGSAIGDAVGRIDFDIPEGQIPDRVELADKINSLIRENHPVTISSMTEDELDARPELVRTMFVKPPRGAGVVRLVLIGEGGKVDLQPCGGTHVKSTGEIGEITVEKIENKGKINRRIRLALVRP
ncbi:MAG: alanyl-tRNA editing protein [Hyphomicrobiales bacterium]